MPVSDKDEEDLLGSLDDSSRFTPVFERHIFEIHRYLSFRVGSDLADDLTAETFLQAFKGRVNYDPSRRSVSAWLFCSATNLVRHHRRDEQRRLRLDCKAALGEPAFPLGEDFSEQIATRSELSEVIADLDRNTRDVVPVVAGAGLTYAETAVALAIPVGTVRSRLSRARIRARLRVGSRPDPLTKGVGFRRWSPILDRGAFLQLRGLRRLVTPGEDLGLE